MSAMTPDQPELDLDRIENHVGSQPYSVVLALLARLRAAEARVAELEATNERLLSSDPSEVCAAWRDGFTKPARQRSAPAEQYQRGYVGNERSPASFDLRSAEQSGLEAIEQWRVEP